MGKYIKQYVFISFDGDTFSAAYKLQQEGEDVMVCQIGNPEVLGTQNWIAQKEHPEENRRRLSLYGGMLKKIPLPTALSKMKTIKNKSECFVVFGDNVMYKIADKVKKMGFDVGIFPTEEDHKREKDRKASKDFVKKNYPGLKVSESKEFSKTDDAIKFIQESNEFWVVKSDGNFGETIVPNKDDLEMAKLQVVNELQNGKALYDKGKLILEPKIMNAIEFSPQMEFFDGEPVFSFVEFETRMFGSADIGDQTGGNQNLLIRTELDAPINKIAFPPAMRKIAKDHNGLFIAEAGILSDGKDLYFTEFQANRWGWPGIFSELSASEGRDGKISNYFESLVMRENPFQHKFGSSVALYTIRADKKYAQLNQEGMSINIKRGSEKDLFLWQCKLEEKGKEKQLVNVGYREFDESPLGYAVGRGETMEAAVKSIYKSLEGLSMKGVYFRPQSDFLATDYVSSIPNRLKFLQDKKLL